MGPQIDAAMTWHRNNLTYFFSGRYYWKYDDVSKTFSTDYPNDIDSGWEGLPSQIDAAHSSVERKETYFISGNQIYVYDDL